MQRIESGIAVLRMGAHALLADWVDPEHLARRILCCNLLLSVSGTLGDLAASFIVQQFGMSNNVLIKYDNWILIILK